MRPDPVSSLQAPANGPGVNEGRFTLAQIFSEEVGVHNHEPEPA